MKKMSFSEENYIKTIYYLSNDGTVEVAMNAIASRLATKASSVTDMIKKLAEKQLVDYRKYQGVTLTKKGSLYAVKIIRNHRLWEFFLVNKLGFPWDEIHEIAEELEHITSEKLVNRLDAFLDYPVIDPHGEPIPDKDGNIPTIDRKPLASALIGEQNVIIGVNDLSSDFLKYLDKVEISLGDQITVTEKELFDGSMTIKINNRTVRLSSIAAHYIFIQKKPIHV